MDAPPVCFWCGEGLEHRAGEGWVHHGGSAIMMRCDRCGNRAALVPTPIACPECGDDYHWRSDHTALPKVDDSAEHPAFRPVPLRGQGIGE